jgi:hypothetical protein
LFNKSENESIKTNINLKYNDGKNKPKAYLENYITGKNKQKAKNYQTYCISGCTILRYTNHLSLAVIFLNCLWKNFKKLAI